MKIKHWQGYGSVNAKVVQKRMSTLTPIRMVKIQVWGNHEYGIDRSDDYYDINQWLLKKVARINIDYRNIQNIEFKYLPNIDGQEAAEYTITYKE